MPGETVLDKLVTVLAFNTDLAGLRRFDDKVRDTRKRLDGLSSAGFNVGRQLTVAGGVVAGAFGVTVKQAVEWESEFTGVRKTVNATEEEFAALESTLRRMAREDVPVPVGELAQLAEVGGQLGIEVAQMAKFVRVMADLGVAAPSISAEEAAVGLARFANVTNMSQDDFDRAASAIVEMGNSFETTEREVLEFARRLAGTGNVIGLTQAEILGLAAGVSTVGINAEAGGTAFSRIFSDMDAAVQTGSEDLEVFGRVLDRTGGEFAGLFKADPAQAILQFVNGMGAMIENGDNVHAVLEELGFDNVRTRDLILLTAGAGDKLNEIVAASTKAWDENAALTREAELRYGTMASRFQFAKNRANDLAITVGGVLAPIITDLVDRLEPLIARVSEFVEANPGAIKWLAGLAAGLVAIGGGLIAIGVAMKAASLLLGLVQGIGALISGVALIGIGPFLLVIGALVGGAILIIKYWDEIKAFFTGFWEGFVSETGGIKDAFARVRDEIARVIDKLGLFKGEAANAADASEDAGNSVGRFFGDVLTVLLDALAVIIRGVTDLAIALAWVLKFIGVPEALRLIWDALLVVKNGIEALIAGVWWVIDAIWALDAAATDGTRALIGMFDIDLFAQGQAMLQSFIDGFMSKVGELQGAVTGALSDARDLLPFSDAKEGPLADLTASGQAIVDTLAAGIRQAGGDVLDRALQVELAGVPAMPDLQAPAIPRLACSVYPWLAGPDHAGLAGPCHPRLACSVYPGLAGSRHAGLAGPDHPAAGLAEP